MDPKLPTPCVHSNGTGERGLIEQSRNVYNNLRQALSSMREARPNGRDYYPLGDWAYPKARDAHDTLYKQISDIANAYARLANNIELVARGEEPE